MGHIEVNQFFLTNLGKYELILGRKWLRKHNPLIDWSKDLVQIHSNFCKENCLPANTKQITAPSFKGGNITPDSQNKIANIGRPRKVGASPFHLLSKQDNVQIFSLSLYELDVRLKESGINHEPSPQISLMNHPPLTLHQYKKCFENVIPRAKTPCG